MRIWPFSSWAPLAVPFILPACYAYIGALLPFLSALVYLKTASMIRGFGAATVLNGFIFVLFLIAGEADTAYIIGTVYNLFCFGLLAGQFSYTFFVDSFILKAVLLPIVLYLLHLFRDRDAFFFYTKLVRTREDLVRHGYLRG